jgi:hypothetical protein
MVDVQRCQPEPPLAGKLAQAIKQHDRIDAA